MSLEARRRRCSSRSDRLRDVVRKTCGAAMTCKHGAISRASSHMEHPWDVVRGIHIALEGGGGGRGVTCDVHAHVHAHCMCMCMSRARAVRMEIMICVVGFHIQLFRPARSREPYSWCGATGTAAPCAPVPCLVFERAENSFVFALR